jgi:hypothetical protein
VQQLFVLFEDNIVEIAICSVGALIGLPGVMRPDIAPCA